MPKPVRPVAAKFWERVSVRGEDDCWEFDNAGQCKDGYGYVSHNNRLLKAHRVSWVLHFGEIPDGMFVCHHCDNPACVNPKHLFIGTPKDNVDDMIRKGRQASPDVTRHAGENNGRAKVSNYDRELITLLRRSGAKAADLARIVGVDVGQISRICVAYGFRLGKGNILSRRIVMPWEELKSRWEAAHTEQYVDPFEDDV